jgi:exodeoxyribonuclease VIII
MKYLTVNKSAAEDNMTHSKLIGLQKLSNEDYHSTEGISSSNLKLLEESPLHLKNKNLFKLSGSHLDFGSLVHSLILEPEKTDLEFIREIKVDARTTAGKKAKAEFAEQAQGRIIISHDEYIKAEIMSKNVLAIAGNILRNGKAEQSYFADDDGLLIKCRPDYYIESAGILVDVKTTADISEYGLRKSITNYHYNWSAVFYMKVLRLLGLKANKFIFVFVEKSQPHMVKIRELTEYELGEADYEMEKMLDSYKRFLKTGKASVVKEIESFRSN